MVNFYLKNLKRATIIGERTRGGAHPGCVIHLSNHFSVFVPKGRAINPITNTNWEGYGVEPDVKVSAEHALKIAYVMALSKSLETLKDEITIKSIKQLIEQMQKECRVPT